MKGGTAVKQLHTLQTALAMFAIARNQRTFEIEDVLLRDVIS